MLQTRFLLVKEWQDHRTGAHKSSKKFYKEFGYARRVYNQTAIGHSTVADAHLYTNVTLYELTVIGTKTTTGGLPEI